MGVGVAINNIPIAMGMGVAINNIAIAIAIANAAIFHDNFSGGTIVVVSHHLHSSKFKL